MSIQGMTNAALALPRVTKRILALSVDSSLCVLTVWLALYLRLGEFVSLSGSYLLAVLGSLLLALPVFVVHGLYRAIFRYSGWPALLAVARASAIYALLYAAIFTAIGFEGVPRTVGLIQPMLLMLTVGASRLLARFWLGGLYQSQLALAALPKALVYGAGSAGRQLVTAMSNSHEIRAVGFLDDDERLHGQVLNGLAIYSPLDLDDLIISLNVTDVLMALPSISRKRRNEILARISASHVSVRTLPSLVELAQGRVSITDVRELDIDDLLGRESIPPDKGLLARNIAGKVVLVTGAGGSIGSELCRQIVPIGPRCLLLLEQSEFALYQLHQELSGRMGSTGIELVPLLGSVRDAARMSDILTAWRPDTLYHAAAYKHVPLVEHNPVEGIENNVLGTLITARAAIEQQVADFVLISTDKAVRPTNIMGASKRLAEMVLQALAAEVSDTRFSMVRFGNVLGSSGSVVPLFRQQIKDGGPITLTHTEITRYFMTIPEAAQLVIQAGAMARGGDVFVLDMGEPVKILDLARRMVELSGLRLDEDEEAEGDIAITLTGLRPGEKLYEELLIGDNPQRTRHPRIMKAHEEFLPWATLENRLQALRRALEHNELQAVRDLLKQLVSGYAAEGDIVDWLYLQQMADKQL
jgi:FlaA1/EpsC-like NDP-sugar epimerase